MTVTVIRADASASQGTGHLMRCLALAHALDGLDARSVLAVAECPLPLLERLRSEGVAVVEIDAEAGTAADVAATLELAREEGAAWVMLDGYRFTVAVQRALRAGGVKVGMIDDFAHLEAYEVDLLLNQNSQASAADYPGVPTLLLGPAHALLRPEFVEALRGRRARSFDGPVQRLLVTMGGSDPGNATSGVLEALSRLDLRGVETRVIVGAANLHRDAVERAAAGVPGAAVIEPVKDMVPMLEWADLAVCAGGSTLWEMAAFGVPAACVVLAENQAPIVDDLERRGMIVHLGWDRDLAPEACAVALGALLGDGQQRQRMSEVGLELVDGAGAARVARAMISSAPPKGRS